MELFYVAVEGTPGSFSLKVKKRFDSDFDFESGMEVEKAAKLCEAAPRLFEVLDMLLNALKSKDVNKIKFARASAVMIVQHLKG